MCGVENGLLGDFSLIDLDDKKKREESINQDQEDQDQVMMGKIERNIELKDELGGEGSKISFSQVADISSDSHHQDKHDKYMFKKKEEEEDDQKKKDWIIIPHTIILSPNTQVFPFLCEILENDFLLLLLIISLCLLDGN